MSQVPIESSNVKTIAGVMRWGVWGADLSTSQMATLITQCLDIGITTFDNADIYGGYTTEKAFGDAWRSSGISRSEFKIITKCGIKYVCDNRPYNVKHYDTSSAYVEEAVDNSLRELQTDYIDQVLIHRPSPLMNLAELAETFRKITESGKVDSFGVSNFTPYELDHLSFHYPVAANQIEISIAQLSPYTDGSLISAATNEVEVQAWSPLGGGILWNPTTQDEKDRWMRLSAVADNNGWSLDEMAYLFLGHHFLGISPVVGSSKIDRITTAVNCESKSITDEQWFEIYTASLGHKVP